jgi:hypothetical protein
MNVGAKAAEGHIIAHLHGDDIYCSDKSLEIAASHLLKSEAAWLYGRCMDIINGKLYENNFTSKRYSYDALLRRNIIPHPSTFYKLQTFREIGGFSEQYKGAMDYDLWLRLGKIGDPVQVADYLAAFRSHVDSYSTKNRFACHNEALKIRLKHAPRGAVSWGEHLVRHVIRSISMMNETPQWASRE